MESASLGTTALRRNVLLTLDCNCHKDLRTCEMLNLSGRKWKALPSMLEARSDFNPCAFRGFVYLCGLSSYVIEAFDPELCVFLELSVRLPERSACLLVVERGQLLVLSDNYATWWEADQRHNLIQLSQTQHSQNSATSCAPPVLDSVNGLIYTVDSGKFYVFSLDGNAKTRITNS